MASAKAFHHRQDTRQEDVLVIDPSPESRDVFQTALAQRGWRTVVAAEVDEGLKLARHLHPRVIVVDWEAFQERNAAPDSYQALVELSHRHDASLVVLGRVSTEAASSIGSFVEKPYHYGPLIRRIEALCQRQRNRKPQAA